MEPDYAKCHLGREGEDLLIQMPRRKGPAFEASFPLSAFAKRLHFELLRIRPAYSSEGWTQHSFPEFEVAGLAKALQKL